MVTAEFEEKSYEGPLYNQLERANALLFTPGQVLENTVGFDRGLLVAQLALWQTLGYKSPLKGAALAYYDWPYGWGPPSPRTQLPRFRLNLFLQAKRPGYYKRRPRPLRGITTISAPLRGFKVTEDQQRVLEMLAAKAKGRAHVAYASAVFHTNAALFSHTKLRTVMQNSTFPSVAALSGPRGSPKTGQSGSPQNRPVETMIQDIDPDVRTLSSVLVSNVLSEEKKQQVIALGRLGWPLRRIQRETGVRRETISAYLKEAGVALRPPRGRRLPAKPASRADEVTPDSPSAKPASRPRR